MRFLLAILLLVSIVYSNALSFCTDFDNNDVPGCNLKGHACRVIKVFSSDVYEVTFRDPTTGVSGSFSSTDQNVAGQQAITNLFLNDLGCNCFSLSGSTSPVAVGHCNMNARACFYFKDRNALNNKVASYKVVLNNYYHNVQVVEPAETQNDIPTALTNAVARFMGADNIQACFDPADTPTCKRCTYLNSVCPFQGPCYPDCYYWGTECSQSVIDQNSCPSSCVAQGTGAYDRTSSPLAQVASKIQGFKNSASKMAYPANDPCNTGGGILYPYSQTAAQVQEFISKMDLKGLEELKIAAEQYAEAATKSN